MIRRYSKTKDITGQRFGMLVAQWPVGRNHDGITYWLFLCDCGILKIAKGRDARCGDVQSCGCIRVKHGHTRGRQVETNRGSVEYRAWGAMIQRCTNPNNPAWEYYGGRGISVCDRWLTFANFIADMGLRPAGLTLERMDNDKGYSPDNCKWATRKAQMLNRRKATHCRRGHEFTSANIRLQKGRDGKEYRVCRKCVKVASLSHYRNVMRLKLCL